jgi:hypothetical protein
VIGFNNILQNRRGGNAIMIPAAPPLTRLPTNAPSRRPELRMFFVEYFTCRFAPTPRNVFADSVATAEGYNDQNKQGCNLYNQLH